MKDMNEVEVFEAIHSARALRRFKSDPVPDELITKILKAATCAPSAGNRQDWLFVVISAPEQRRRVGAVYAKASALVRPFYTDAMRPPSMNEDAFRRLQASGFYLHEHMADAPLLILVGARERANRNIPGVAPEAEARELTRLQAVSVYPAVQNIVLACRALGLGTVLTTNHILCEEEMKAVLELPPDVETFALMPIGYPVNKFGPVQRKPLSDVAVRDRWGNPWTGTE
jgi:nitroreductase